MSGDYMEVISVKKAEHRYYFIYDKESAPLAAIMADKWAQNPDLNFDEVTADVCKMHMLSDIP